MDLNEGVFKKNSLGFDADHLLSNCGAGLNDTIIFSRDLPHSRKRFVLNFRLHNAVKLREI